MNLPQIFIGSSSEGIKTAKIVHKLLLDELPEKAVVRRWTRGFRLMSTNIESLEKITETTDFAVLIMAPEDYTQGRGTERAAPRDNVVFELGLFMGCIGRDRCFIISEKRSDLKIPSDLLGIQPATFTRTKDIDLEHALEASCIEISDAIEETGPRHKVQKGIVETQERIHEYSKTILGYWWEKVEVADANQTISHLEIELDEVINSVKLSGKTYDLDGQKIADWKSLLGRIDVEERKVLYHWDGRFTKPDIITFPFHGFGEIKFDKPEANDGLVYRGEGKFWEVNEIHPEKTIIKKTEFRRSEDDEINTKMTKGSDKEISNIIQNKFAKW